MKKDEDRKMKQSRVISFLDRLEYRVLSREGLFLFLGEPMGRAKDDLAAIDDP